MKLSSFSPAARGSLLLLETSSLKEDLWSFGSVQFMWLASSSRFLTEAERVFSMLDRLAAHILTYANGQINAHGNLLKINHIAE